MKALVVYYSRTGITKKAAELLATKLCTECIEIVDTNKRKGIWGFINSGREVAMGKLANINPIDKDLSTYDCVVVCTPIWASKISSPVRAFMAMYGKQLKGTVYIFTSGGEAKDGNVSNADAMDKYTNCRHIALASISNRQKNLEEAVSAFSKKLM